jgi:hypothetical protein
VVPLWLSPVTDIGFLNDGQLATQSRYTHRSQIHRAAAAATAGGC